MSFGADVWARLALPIVLMLPWKCSLKWPVVEAPRPPHQEATERVVLAPPPGPGVRTVRLPDEVVLKAVAAGENNFRRCWAIAQRKDPYVMPGKVVLHLTLDERGKVTAVVADTESAPLARCLEVVSRQLPFPAPGQAAAVELPLVF